MENNVFFGIITARGNSKRLTGKNVRPLAGKPLIAWTIEAAAASRRLDRFIVTTEDEEIARVSRQYGAEVPFMRPIELSQDDSSHFSVIEHAINWMANNANYRPNYIVLLHPTSPFRNGADIDDAIELSEKTGADAVVSVNLALTHPILTRKMDEKGVLTEFISSDIPYKRRQVLPKAYQINGAVYVNRVEALMRDRDFSPPGTIGFPMPPDRSMDIDDLWELHLAELVARNPFDPDKH